MHGDTVHALNNLHCIVVYFLVLETDTLADKSIMLLTIFITSYLLIWSNICSLAKLYNAECKKSLQVLSAPALFKFYLYCHELTSLILVLRIDNEKVFILS